MDAALPEVAGSVGLSVRLFIASVKMLTVSLQYTSDTSPFMSSNVIID